MARSKRKPESHKPASTSQGRFIAQKISGQAVECSPKSARSSKRPLKEIAVDQQKRITLGKDFVPDGVSSYEATLQEDGSILLVPFVKIPAREAWLFQNQDALASVQRGMEDARSSRVKSLGGFAEFLDNPDDADNKDDAV